MPGAVGYTGAAPDASELEETDELIRSDSSRPDAARGGGGVDRSPRGAADRPGAHRRAHAAPRGAPRDARRHDGRSVFGPRTHGLPHRPAGPAGDPGLRRRGAEPDRPRLRRRLDHHAAPGPARRRRSDQDRSRAHPRRAARGALRPQPAGHVFVREYESKRVAVSGAVKKPGTYEMLGRKTLLEMLSMAGGLDRDLGREIIIFRPDAEGATRRIPLDLERLVYAADPALNLPVEPGDIIYVPNVEKIRIFVTGAVKQPDMYEVPRDEPISVLKAVTLAGGTTDRAALKRVQIMRSDPDGNRVTLEVNLQKIRRGKARTRCCRRATSFSCPNRSSDGPGRPRKLTRTNARRSRASTCSATGRSSCAGAGWSISPSRPGARSRWSVRSSPRRSTARRRRCRSSARTRRSSTSRTWPAPTSPGPPTTTSTRRSTRSSPACRWPVPAAERLGLVDHADFSTGETEPSLIARLKAMMPAQARQVGQAGAAGRGRSAGARLARSLAGAQLAPGPPLVDPRAARAGGRRGQRDRRRLHPVQHRVALLDDGPGARVPGQPDRHAQA